jgi:predicted lipoprotein
MGVPFNGSDRFQSQSLNQDDLTDCREPEHLSIRIETDQVLARLERLHDAMAPLLEDEKFSDLQGLHIDLSQLHQLINDQAATVLGVNRGFNSSDGD